MCAAYGWLLIPIPLPHYSTSHGLAGSRVRGVEYVHGSSGGGEVHVAEAGLETVLAAGAVGSPQLLQLSGKIP